MEDHADVNLSVFLSLMNPKWEKGPCNPKKSIIQQRSPEHRVAI